MNSRRNNSKSRKHQSKTMKLLRAAGEDWFSLGAQYLRSVTCGADEPDESPIPIGMHGFRLELP